MEFFAETFLIVTGSILFLMMLPVLYRIVIGPTAIDRIVAVNIIGTKTAVLLIVIGSLFGDVGMFVDFALAYALLNFIASLAAARYIARTRSELDPGSARGEGAF
jgi:multicomponent Na+:H+ antiporter subunit F